MYSFGWTEKNTERVVRAVVKPKPQTDRLYLEIRDKWNELRLKDADPDILIFLVHLMDELMPQ